jgi:hypothetical protein
MARLAHQHRKMPVARQRHSVLYLCLVALSTFNYGCGDSGTEQKAKTEPEDTAKEDFDWAMERLQQALDTSGSVARLNLRVKRDLSYELLPPDGSRANYAARVTIKTRSDYIPDAPIIPQSDEDAQPSDLALDTAEDSTDPLDPTQNLRTKQPLFAELPTRIPNIEETKVYELAYLEKRWQLQTELESDHEKMWFEYSLQE